MYPPNQQPPYQQPYYALPFCSACGKLNAADAKFCNNCAKPIISQQHWGSVQVNSQRLNWWESQSKGIRATIVIGSLVFLFCVAGLLILEKRDKSRQSQIAPSAPTGNSTVKKTERNLYLWKYNNIKMGMKREEVTKILGSKGDQTSYSSDSQGEKTSFTWQEGEGVSARRIKITFINGQVYDKSQSGLE